MLFCSSCLWYTYQATGAAGVNIVSNAGPAAGQEVRGRSDISMLFKVDYYTWVLFLLTTPVYCFTLLGCSLWQVFHMHFHVIPRADDDKLQLKLPASAKEMISKDDATAMLEAIQAKLK